MRKSLGIALGMSALLVGTFVGSPAGADSMDATGPHNAYCGAWVGGSFTPNGNCVRDNTVPKIANAGDPSQASSVTDSTAPLSQKIAGRVMSVQGHLITLKRGKNTLVIDDQPALDHNLAGNIATGHVIKAHGLWRDGTFYAHSFDMTS